MDAAELEGKATSADVGRGQVISVIAVLLLVSLSTIAVSNLLAGPDRLGQQFVRFVLTLVL